MKRIIIFLIVTALFVQSSFAQIGVRKSPATVAAIYTSTADAPVVNTITETTIIGTGTGTKIIAANYLKVGKSYRITGSGIYSTPALPGNATVKIKLGSTVVATATATGSLLTANSANYGCTLEILITVRSVGASGSVKIGGAAIFTTNPTSGSIARLDFFNGGTAVTLDTTVAQTIDITLQWSNAQVGQGLTGTHALIEEIN